MILIAAALVFAVVLVLTVGVWWAWAERHRVRQRIAAGAPAGPEAEVLRIETGTRPSGWERLVRRSDIVSQLAALGEQAGSRLSAADLVLLLAAFAAGGAILGWWRFGTIGGAVLSALLATGLPVLRLVHRRHRRLKRFQEQFADAVDMVARSIRAGNALTAAIQLVGEEMGDPVGHEFRRVGDEIRLGLDPGEALGRLQRRVPAEDVAFFCAAINIQRGSGGNLAEILDRLSDVIRKRFELLSHARVLSAQQRYAAVFVGLSPLLFSAIFYVLSPGYFEPLMRSPAAPMMIAAGLVMEVIGFAIIWRLAQIKV